MNPLSKKHFWDWFKRHNQEYLDLKDKSKKETAYWLNELNTHLRAYFKCLGYAIEWKPKQACLIITVDGKARHFKKADALVAKAPKIPGWTIMALEEPRAVDFLLEPLIMESGIDPRELYFSLDENGVLNIYHPLCTSENRDIIYQLAHSAVYNLLGERSFGNDIREIEVANLSEADREELKELEELPGCVNGCWSSMMIDSRGNLLLNY